MVVKVTFVTIGTPFARTGPDGDVKIHIGATWYSVPCDASSSLHVAQPWVARCVGRSCGSARRV